MKFLKRILIGLLFLILLSVLLKGWLYRLSFEYEIVGERVGFNLTNVNLKTLIDQGVNYEDTLDVQEIIDISLKITSNQLSFSATSCYSDPNKLISSKKANCIGYAAFLTTVCNYLLHKNNLSRNWRAKSKVCHLYLFGKNVHNYFKSAFLKDHDCAIIENEITGQIFAIDPSLNDYLFIDYVTIKE